MKRIAAIIIVLPLLLVGGCGVYRNKFDCSPGSGIGCESVSQVNELVNNERLDDFIEEINSPKKRNCLFCSKERDVYEEVELASDVKKGEKLKIYFNEHKDTRGVLYKPSEVEVEIK